MPLFNSRGISTAAVLGLLTVVAVVFAVVGYMEWSSHAAWAEFMSATTSSASDQDRSNESATPVQSPFSKFFRPSEQLPLANLSLFRRRFGIYALLDRPGRQFGGASGTLSAR